MSPAPVPSLFGGSLRSLVLTWTRCIYALAGDSIILNCQADGTPVPEILWYKDGAPVEPSGTVGIFNDGTELRISTIRNEDIGDYTCIARNGEGQVTHTARVIIAGGAVIMVNTFGMLRYKKKCFCWLLGLTVREYSNTMGLIWMKSYDLLNGCWDIYYGSTSKKG